MVPPEGRLQVTEYLGNVDLKPPEPDQLWALLEDAMLGDNR